MKKSILITVATCITLNCSDLLSSPSQGLMDMRDQPVYLPSYHGSASLAGITGVVTLRATYKNGRVKSVERVISDLNLPSLPGNSRRYVALIEDKLMNAVKQWRSFFLNSFQVDVIFELRQEDLPGNQRSYVLEYDDKGVITKVIITDPIAAKGEAKRN